MMEDVFNFKMSPWVEVFTKVNEEKLVWIFSERGCIRSECWMQLFEFKDKSFRQRWISHDLDLHLPFVANFLSMCFCRFSIVEFLTILL